MNVVIQARQFRLTTGVSEHIERRLRFALDRVNDRIGRVSVGVSDVNGPRGGQDKCCRIQVVIPGEADVVIEEVETDLYVAIDRAIDRTARTLARRVARQREHRHESLRRTSSTGLPMAATDEAAPSSDPPEPGSVRSPR